MAGSKKARIRSLERQLGSVGADPFIPARQPGSPATRTAGGVAPVAARRRTGRTGMMVALAGGVVLAALGAWSATFARATLAADVQRLHLVPSGADRAAALVISGAAVLVGSTLALRAGMALRRARARDAAR